MSELVSPRDYQEECITDLLMRRDRGDNRIPSVLATGLGKTVIFAHLVARWITENPMKRAMIVVDTDELVGQTVKKMKDASPLMRVGIVKATQNEVTARIIVASAQTLQRKARRDPIRNVGLGVIDECDVAPGRTKAIMDHFPDAFWVGFTATLARADRQKLSDVWSACTFVRSIAFGIRRGYLLDVRGKRIVVPDLDLSSVKKSGGDFQDAALGDAMDAALAPSIIAEAYVEHAKDRKGIVFWPLVETAYHGAAAFEEAGIPSAVVHGGTPKEERRLILKKLHTGEIQCVHNCNVLTRGFDEPTVSCIVIPPTKSGPAYQQKVGRGLRPDLSLPPSERGDCLVLEVVGARRMDHNLRTLIDLSTRADEGFTDEDLEDMSLLEMEDAALEAEGENEQITTEEYYGAVAAEDFDPLARTGIGAWLKTAGGTYFLPVGKEAYVLLVPSEEPNRWDVAYLTQNAAQFLHASCSGMDTYVTTYRHCSCGAGHQGAQGDLTEHRGLSLDMATSWAEEVMEELGGSTALTLAGTKKRWRKGEVSDPQRNLAARMGIVVTETMTKGDVADLITTSIGSRRIDPVVGFMLAAREGA